MFETYSYLNICGDRITIMTHDSVTTYDQPLGGNSPASRDIAFHMHPYTNPAVLREAGPHMRLRGKGSLWLTRMANDLLRGDERPMVYVTWLF